MVVFVDFEQDGDHNLHHHDDGRKFDSNIGKGASSSHDGLDREMETSLKLDDERTNPNLNAFSASLSCYPYAPCFLPWLDAQAFALTDSDSIIKRIAQSVDLNTLHVLSRTCRQFRANLMPFRSQLIKLTLRCEYENVERYANASTDELILSTLSRHAPQLTSGKIGLCARDMVAECQRCTRVICRNCCTKPPTRAMLKHRLRRLCATCLAAPLSCHLSPPSQISLSRGINSHSFAGPAVSRRTPCSCEDSVWLCKPCGRALANEDTTYNRGWTWRTRYSTYLGGLGTGIGEGCQGVKCGRGEFCLAAQDIEVEIDCSSDEWAANQHDNGHGHGPEYHHEPIHYRTIEGREGRDEEEPGYLSQEIEGVGGVVKRKVKKRLRVGACVEEHEDERETAEYLTREQSGQDRSWCGWCSRVVLGKKDSVENSSNSRRPSPSP